MTIKALYATNVYHYDHVVMAMKSVFEEVNLVRRFEISPNLVQRVERLGVPSTAANLLRRRMRNPSSVPEVVRSLGIAQVVLPSMTRLGVKVRPSHVRWVTDAYAARVAAEAKGHDVLHFVEGLGYRALEKQSFRLSICERRSFHYSAFEREIRPLANFPSHKKKDHLRSVLDLEFERADFIVVYSEVAKQSFIDEGFESSRILVSPIGIGNQLPKLTAKRDKYKLTFVGRGDIHKGIDVAVEAVREMGSPYRLVVAGFMPPEVLPWLSKQSHVDYVGILNREELRKLYSTASAMILPSIESYGLAAAEAAYHGLHIFCSNFTGIGEYLPRTACSIIFGRNPSVWAEKVVEFLEDAAVSYHPLADEVLGGLDLESASERLAEIYSTLSRKRLAGPEL